MLQRDVWRSSDGRSWTPRTLSAPWPGRKFFGCEMDTSSTMFVVGGSNGVDGSSGLGDTWRSTDDGATWAVVSLAAPWTARHSFSLVSLPGGPGLGRLYIIGGHNGRAMHDVWLSNDKGLTWNLARFEHTMEQTFKTMRTVAPWGPRWGMGAVADSEGLLTMVGGRVEGSAGDSDTYLSEVWTLDPPVSADNWYDKKNLDERINKMQPPLTWELDTEDPGWAGRSGHATVMDEDGYVYVLGGRDSKGLRNDVWKSE